MNNSLAYLYLHTHEHEHYEAKNCNRHNLIIDDGKSIEIMCISNVHKYYKTVLVHSEKHSLQQKKEQFEIKLFFFLVEISYILYAYKFLSTCIYLIDPTCAINVQSE